MRLPTDDSTMPLARFLTLACGAVCMLPWTSAPPAPALLLTIVSLVLLVVLSNTRRVVPGRAVVWLMQLIAAFGLVVFVLLSQAPSELWLRAVVAVVIAGLAITTSVWDGRARVVSGYLLAAVYLAAMLAMTRATQVDIDVALFLESGIDALVGGTSPYAITIPNPFTEAESSVFFGPGVVENGRVIYGYPYLPAALVLDTPAHLVGEVRWMHVASLLLAARLGWGMASDRAGRWAALLLASSPVAMIVLVGYWIEPVMVALLIVGVAAMSKLRGVLAGVAIGLLFSSKQYAIAFAPALWTAARHAGWRSVLVAVATGTALMAVFVAADPTAFVRSAIELQFIQPVRDDSISVLPALRESFGLGDWVFWVSPVSGFVVGVLIVWRTRPGPTAFALGVGLSLMVTVLLAKQSFTNYYLLVGAALLCAGITWKSDDPLPGDIVERGSEAPSRPTHWQRTV